MSANPVYWRMRNGKFISIDDMDVNHLRNSLKMVVNNSSNHKEVTSLNGDMAQEFNEADYWDGDESDNFLQ